MCNNEERKIDPFCISPLRLYQNAGWLQNIVHFALMFILRGIVKCAIIFMFMVLHHLLESSTCVICCPLQSATSTALIFVVLTFNIISVIYFSHSFVVRNTTKLEKNSTKTVTPPTNETADILKSFLSTQ